MKFSLDQILTFVAVVDHGGFAPAGRAQNRAQTAVSYAIQRLESQLGDQLFDRSGYRPTLTPAGLALLPYARRIAADVTAFNTQAQIVTGGVEAELDVAFDAMFPMATVTGLLRRLQEQFPSLRLRIRTEVRGRTPQLVVDGTCKIGFNVYRQTPTMLECMPLLMCHVYMVVAPQHPLATTSGRIAIDALRQHVQVVLVDSAGGSGPQDQSEYARDSWRVETVNALVELLRAGVGYGLLPDYIAEREIAAGRLVRLFPAAWANGTESIPLLTHAVWRKDEALGPAAQWFLSQLRAQFSGADDDGMSTLQFELKGAQAPP